MRLLYSQKGLKLFIKQRWSSKTTKNIAAICKHLRTIRDKKLNKLTFMTTY